MNVPIGQLKPNPTNPRVLRDDKFAKLKASIQSFPDMLNKRPIVAVTDKDGKYMVLGGNMRLRACQDLGLKEVPVMLADEWTEEQRREFVVKDNASAGEWDWDMLANEWDEKDLDAWGIPVFAPGDLNTKDLFKDDDPPPPPSKHSIVLNYTEDEHAKVVARFAELGGTREQVVFNLLGL